MQITNYPLAPLTIITNHAPPISSPYWSLTFHANVGSQPYTFPNLLDNALVGPFPPSTFLAPTIAHDQTPQPTPISPTHLQLPPKSFCPTYGRQFTIRRFTYVPTIHPIHLIQTHVTIPLA
jgi:hypothetical protein